MAYSDGDCAKAYTIVLAGDRGVGKSCITQRHKSYQLFREPWPTVGVEFYSRLIQLDSRTTMKANIWDTSGQEQYYNIVSSFFRRAKGAVIVYDVADRESFCSIRKWADAVQERGDPDIVIALVGNKLDLVQNCPGARATSPEEAALYAESKGFHWAEVSAVSFAGIEEAFKTLLGDIHQRDMAKPTQTTNVLLKKLQTEGNSCFRQ